MTLVGPFQVKIFYSILFSSIQNVPSLCQYELHFHISNSKAFTPIILRTSCRMILLPDIKSEQIQPNLLSPSPAPTKKIGRKASVWGQITKHCSGSRTSWMATRPTCSAVLAAQPKSCCGKASMPISFPHYFTAWTRKSTLLQGKSFSLLRVCHAPPEAMQEKEGRRSG